MSDVIEGVAVEVAPEPHALVVVQQPGQALVAEVADPAGMVGVASRLATVLADIVERQRLYAVIQGKKYPTVEAWMTIARLDNVVAREPRPPIRHDDGSYEAFAELVRLSDGMVIGGASALCGSPDDEPWGGTPAKYGKEAKGPRPEHARRSMAQTRATSRAFRQQYSWIMNLAGYEPTPAEEMPSSEAPAPQGTVASSSRGGAPAGPSTLVGVVRKGDGNGMDLNVREEAQAGHVIGFKLMEVEGHPKGRKSTGVRAFGPLALALSTLQQGERVTVRGTFRPESFTKADRSEVHYEVLIAESVEGHDLVVPSNVGSLDVSPAAQAAQAAIDAELDALPW